MTAAQSTLPSNVSPDLARLHEAIDAIPIGDTQPRGAAFELVCADGHVQRIAGLFSQGTGTMRPGAALGQGVAPGHRVAARRVQLNRQAQQRFGLIRRDRPQGCLGRRVE